MPQAVNVVGKAEQERLANLGGQAASGCARGELAFDRRENAFDLGALPVRFFRKGSEHLIRMAPLGTPRRRAGRLLLAQFSRKEKIRSRDENFHRTSYPQEQKQGVHVGLLSSR